MGRKLTLPLRPGAISAARLSPTARSAEPQQGPGDVFGQTTGRQRRMSGLLASEKAVHVPPIFAQQRVGLIFRMALEKHGQGSALLDEEVDAGFGRPRQDLVTGRHQRRFRHII